MKRWSVVVAALCTFCCAVPASSSALPAVQDYAGQAYNILAPGEDGGLPATANSTDQARLYDALTPKLGNITAGDIASLFKSERLGFTGTPKRVEHPASGALHATIYRDSYDVPHIYGTTRADVMFGMGWAEYEDRGLLMSEGRDLGRVAAVGVPGVNAFNLLEQLRTFVPTAQTEAFMNAQTRVLAGAGAQGRQVLGDLHAWLAGINAYLAATYPVGVRPAPWTLADGYAAFTFIGSIFGNGGGGEVANSDLLARLRAEHGSAAGTAIFRDLKQTNDPSAPVTIPGTFNYNSWPSGSTPGSLVVDPGSLSTQASAAEATAASTPHRLMSNALLVGASRSASGHPLAVMGPQLGYFYPEIVMEADAHGGGIDMRGAVAPVMPYVLIGRGADYAWSLTSASNDNTDQFLDQLCNANGSPATRASTGYMYRGRCVPMAHFDAGTLLGTGGGANEELTFYETVHGPVSGTVTVGGKPYAVATLRSTRGREPASLLAFADLSDGAVHSPQTFLHAASKLETTFNMFYVDSRNIAYFSSGRLPVRAPGTNPALPTLGTGAYDWRGFLPASRHPQGINPASGLIVNWNNKPARGWGAADDDYSYGAIHRVQLFTGLKRRGNTLVNVVSVMNNAATQDLRARLVWPVIARVLSGGAAPSPLAAQAAQDVSAWVASGAHRLDTTGDGLVDAPGAAVMDAAWPLLARAVLSPVLGDLTSEFASIDTVDNNANSGGSSYGDGWYGYVYRDLERQLGHPLPGAFSRAYCGGGSLAACRASLWSAVQTAAAQLAASQGANPGAWHASATAERIVFAPGLLAATMRWTNRSTFQQVITFTGHR